MIVYDILCVSVFLHSTNGRHARTFYKKCIGRFFVTQESLFKKIYGRAPKVYAAFVMLLISQAKGWRKENMFTQINNFITWFDGVVWGLPLIILILVTGFLLTVRLGFLQVRHLGKALKFMVKMKKAARVKSQALVRSAQLCPQLSEPVTS